MFYKSEIESTMVDILKDRMSSIADSILVLLENGYIPNKNKIFILSWSPMLINAFETIDLLNDEQRHKLINLTNKILGV